MEKYSLPDLFWIKRIRKKQLKMPKTESWVEKEIKLLLKVNAFF